MRQLGGTQVQSDANPAERTGAPIDALQATPLGEIPVELADNLIRSLNRLPDDMATVDVARFGSAL